MTMSDLFRPAFDAFLHSGQVEEAIERATRAGWGGPSEGLLLELFEDGTYRLCDKNSVGNLYISQGILIEIPQLTPDEWDEEMAYFGNAIEALEEKFAYIGEYE